MSEELSPSHRKSPDGGTEHRDVNDVVEEEWTEETTPFERMYEVISRVYDPLSVA